MQTPLQPLAFELIARSLVDGDFMSMIDPRTSQADLRGMAELSVDNASDDWEQSQGGVVRVDQDIKAAAIERLMTHAESILSKVMGAADDAVRDAIESGEVRSARNW